MKRVLFFAVILALCAPLLSQTKVVEGDLIVYNRYPVKNVKVISKKAKSSTLTDSLGHFRLVCNTKDVIAIESEVFASQNIRVGKSDNVIKRQNLIFIDNPKNRNLATGYGHISEDNLSFAIDNLESILLQGGHARNLRVVVGIMQDFGYFVSGRNIARVQTSWIKKDRAIQAQYFHLLIHPINKFHYRTAGSPRQRPGGPVVRR